MATESCVQCGKLFHPTNPMITICPSCRSAVEIEPKVDTGSAHSIPTAAPASGKPSAIVQPVMGQVKIIDFDMPFGSMVSFMVKWAIASIPAFIILFIIGFITSSVLFGILKR